MLRLEKPNERIPKKPRIVAVVEPPLQFVQIGVDGP
jgi:hypothetical protein